MQSVKVKPRDLMVLCDCKRDVLRNPIERQPQWQVPTLRRFANIDASKVLRFFIKIISKLVAAVFNTKTPGASTTTKTILLHIHIITFQFPTRTGFKFDLLILCTCTCTKGQRSQTRALGKATFGNLCKSAQCGIRGDQAKPCSRLVVT